MHSAHAIQLGRVFLPPQMHADSFIYNVLLFIPHYPTGYPGQGCSAFHVYIHYCIYLYFILHAFVIFLHLVCSNLM